MISRVLSVFKRDLAASLRDHLLVYIFLAPLLLAAGLILFLPDVNSASLQFALDNRGTPPVIETFEQYGEVELYASKADVKKRVLDIDDVAGISLDATGKLELILQGNEAHDTEAIAAMVLRNLEHPVNDNVDFVVTSLGIKDSPVKTIGTVSLLLMAIVIGGMIIGFNLIEEKQDGTVSSLQVTPLRNMEFIAGKSLIGWLAPLVLVYMVLLIMDSLRVDLLMVLFITVVSSFIGVIFGFLVGVMSSNQIAGIANMKLLFLVVGASIIGAVLLPPDKHLFLYWAPPYWSYVAFHDILTQTAVWPDILRYAGIICGLCILILLALAPRVKKISL